jgi:thiol-disulfide isomerase/thioredoxin
MHLQSKILNAINRLLIVSLFFGLALEAKEASLTKHLTKVSPSKVAPALKLEDIDEDIIDIKKLKGKVVIVNFWATWCPPCRREMGSLEELYLKTKKKGVVVLAVNVGEDSDTVFSFLSNLEPSPTFSALLDIDSKAVRRWGVPGLPSTFIINKKGKIVYKAIGGRNFMDKKIIDIVTKLTKE